MPGNILTRMLGCFGDVNQVRGNPPPPAQTFTAAHPSVAAGFVPGRQYVAAELIAIARNNPPQAETKRAFLNAMADAFNVPNANRIDKARLCKHICKLMLEDEVVHFKNAPRQANYFASYSIDLNFQELDVAYNFRMEQDIREMLNLWSNTLCPAQTEFNMDGVIYTREEVTAMLASQSIITRKEPTNIAPTLLDTQMEQLLRNRRGSQNVHEQAVRDSSARVMNIMRQKHGKLVEMTNNEINRFLNPFMRANARQTHIRAGLNHCLTVDGFDSNMPMAMSPRQLLGNVCQYIESTKNPEMRRNLIAALMNRLSEIHVEHPCMTGVSQRLLDVPNGIDPDMNFSGRNAQVGQDVATLAGKTYDRFTGLIEEGLQAIQEIEKKGDITGNDRTITDLGQNMFSTRLDNDLRRRGGISESEIAPHRERLKTGFTH